jgi:LCP family protein required for cell wall assembly
MKHFLRIFGTALLVFTLVIGGGMMLVHGMTSSPEMNFPEPGEVTTDPEVVLTPPDEGSEETPIVEPEPEPEQLSDLYLAMQDSNRINAVIIGMEGPRTDTIIFASIDPDLKRIDLINIPRDTYYYEKGYEEADLRKVNAVHGREGTDGIKTAVSTLLYKTPVDFYVKVNYNGVAAIVNLVGGIEVNVPYDMEYDDEWAEPELHISLLAGRQELNGLQALDFLRFRKSNDGTIFIGDVGRIENQKKVIKAITDKALSYRFISVIETAFDYVKTDMGLANGLKIGTSFATGFSSDSIFMHTLPGDTKNMTFGSQTLNYWVQDYKVTEKTEDLLEEIYAPEIAEIQANQEKE